MTRSFLSFFSFQCKFFFNSVIHEMKLLKLEKENKRKHVDDVANIVQYFPFHPKMIWPEKCIL